MVPGSATLDDVRPGKCAGRGVGRQQDPVSYRSPDSRLLKKFFQVPKFSGCGGTVPDRGCFNGPGLPRCPKRLSRPAVNQLSYKDRWFVRADL